MVVYYGVVTAGVIRLPEDVELAEGQVVEIHVPVADDEDLVAREKAFYQHLLATGRVLPPANTPQVPIEPIRPDEITGTPLSEILIAERG